MIEALLVSLTFTAATVVLWAGAMVLTALLAVAVGYPLYLLWLFTGWLWTTLTERKA